MAGMMTSEQNEKLNELLNHATDDQVRGMYEHLKSDLMARKAVAEYDESQKDRTLRKEAGHYAF